MLHLQEEDRRSMAIKRSVIIHVMFFNFFASLMAIVGQVMDIRIPNWQQESSLAPASPGLGLLGYPEAGPVEIAVLSYSPKNKSQVLKLAQNMDRYLAPYRMKGSGGSEVNGAENRVACNAYSSPLGENQVCDVPVDDFHPCVSYNQYAFEEGQPCVFLKLDKIYNWKPQVYNTTKDLPADMPQDLKMHIKMVAGHPESNVVWVSCEGENPADKENIGPVQYIPRRGFASYYYPFTNKEGYLSPLVAVLFEQPRPNVVISIECKAWAKNIDNNGYERRGSVSLALMVGQS